MTRCFAIALVFCLAGLPAAAEFEIMQGWSPGAFRVVCGDKSTFEGTPGPDDCIDDATRAAIETLTAAMLHGHRGERFSPPYQFGPVSQPEESQTVRIFTSPNTAYANISPLSGACDPADRMAFTLNPEAAGLLPRNVLAYVTGHELFHTIQGNFPIHMRPGRNGPHNCFPPDWIAEGIADAVSVSKARERYPGFFPPRPGQKAGFSWAGLRPYHLPIYSPGIPKVMQYRTSSFWRYLAEMHHGGRMKFLEDYSMTLPPGGKEDEDWLAWLDDALRRDPQVGTPLYLVYPGFLNHFAADWIKGGDGEKFGRSAWLAHGFGACAKLKLTPETPYAETRIDVFPMAGRCLSVKVAGLGPAELAAIKIGVLTGDEALADSLHLGFAFTNDRTGFNCARLAREGKIPRGIAGCLLEPVTGEFENGGAARLWLGTSLEAGAGPGEAPRDGGGALENVYVLARVPAKPRLPELRAAGAVQVTLAAGLEVARLTAEGADANQGAADGTRKVGRKRAAGAMALRPSDTDRTIPASAGYVDMGPMEQILGREAVDITAGVFEMMGAAIASFPSFVNSGAAVFRLAETEVIPLGGPFDDERLEVKREFTVLPEEPLGEGATGSYPAAIIGYNFARPSLVYGPAGERSANVTVLEDSRGAFRARVSGEVCELDIRAAPATADECPRKFSVSGELSKPFAYLYRTNSELISHRTEGENLYNEFHTARFAFGAGAGGDGSVGDGSGGGARTGSGGGAPAVAGGSLLSCDCACPDTVSPPTGECRSACAPQLAACPAKGEATTPQPPKPTLEAQRRWFSRLVGGQGLAPEVETMLVEDFAAMSDETRAYLIRRYRDGVE